RVGPQRRADFTGRLLYRVLRSRPGALTSKKILARLARADLQPSEDFFASPLLVAVRTPASITALTSDLTDAEAPMATPFDHTSRSRPPSTRPPLPGALPPRAAPRAFSAARPRASRSPPHRRHPGRPRHQPSAGALSPLRTPRVGRPSCPRASGPPARAG